MVTLNAKLLVKCRKFSLLFFIISIPLLVSGTFYWSGLLILLGLIFFLIYLSFSFFLWKCPICKHRLPIRFNFKDDKDINDLDNLYYCPNCKEKIN